MQHGDRHDFMVKSHVAHKGSFDVPMSCQCRTDAVKTPYLFQRKLRELRIAPELRPTLHLQVLVITFSFPLSNLESSPATIALRPERCSLKINGPLAG